MMNSGLKLRDQLSAVIRAYADASGLSLARVSTLVFSDGKRATKILAGETDITTGTYERAMQWFAANWPADAAWPAGIARPEAAA